MSDTIKLQQEKLISGSPVKAKVVANYILALSNPEEGDLISHLKLQKLLYYCQGFHLALHNNLLFEEKIKHWEHGPVVEEIYHIFKSSGSNALTPQADADFTSLSQSQKETINEVYDVYGQFSAWKLRQMTHDEAPWKNTKDGEEITPSTLNAFFKKRLLA